MKALSASLPFRREINVTPLVDVVLVLLIVFMVATPLIQRGYEVAMLERRLDVAPPPSEDQIVVSLEEDGRLRLNRQAIGQDQLGERLTSILKDRASRTVFFSGADVIDYGRALAAIDVIRKAGAMHIGIAPSPTDLESK